MNENLQFLQALKDVSDEDFNEDIILYNKT